MKSVILFSLITLFSLHAAATEPVLGIYDSIQGEVKPERELFYRSLAGLQKLQRDERVRKSDIITIIDFRLPSTSKRLWVIDLSRREVIFHSLVAHGKNSGDNTATRFSNKDESLQSSLGFFMTGSEYYGKHGRSLKLIGLEKGINDAAERRAIVIHGAHYVSDEYIRNYGRIGRSFGCPAVPMGFHEKLIDKLGEGALIFIFYPDSDYMTASSF